MLLTFPANAAAVEVSGLTTNPMMTMATNDIMVEDEDKDEECE